MIKLIYSLIFKIILSMESIKYRSYEKNEREKGIDIIMERLKQDKNIEFAIVSPGWAMKWAWILGAIQGLEDKWIKANYVLWPSASAWTLAYYASWQFEKWTNIWLNWLADNKKFLKPNSDIKLIWRLFLKRIAELKYLNIKVKEILLGMFTTSSSVSSILENPEDVFSWKLKDFEMLLDPGEVIRLFSNDIEDWGKIKWVKLNLEELKKSNITLIVPLRDDKNWNAFYITNKKWVDWATYLEWEEFMKALEATKAVPRLSWYGRNLNVEWVVIKSSDWSFADPLPIEHSLLSRKSLPLWHEILSNDWLNLKDSIIPIIILPENTDRPKNKYKWEVIERILNLLDSNKVGTIFNKWDEIYTKEYLDILKKLEAKWKIILIDNKDIEINQLDNSKEALRTTYDSGRKVVNENLIIKMISEFLEKS